MTIKPGTYTLGPSDGTLQVRTGRSGMASKVGHDLTLEASNWNATVTIDADPSRSEVKATIEPRSLEVVAATGGAKPVSEKDKKDIKNNIAGLLGNNSITFQSTSVQAKSDTAATVTGDLSIAGQSRQATLDLTLQPDGTSARLKGRVPIVQSSFGVKPFSAMMGALKVKDEVEVDIDVRLPSE
ncbi:MAG TPA: YceI family protein [Acidimicrobiia bacterium]|nr:YceI family protein [Acidimicrobiia bacterium]